MGRRVHLALFGNVKMLRGFCAACGDMALIRAGRFLCCDAPATDEPTCAKRYSEPDQQRRLPPLRDRQAVLESQEHRCAYCFRGFGTFFFRHDKPSRLRVHWDHVVPYSWSQDNATHNFVAACHVCNLLKGDRLFMTFDEARIYLQRRWVEKYATPAAHEEEGEHDEAN